MKLLCLLAMVAYLLMAQPASAASGPWEQPAAALAEQIAAILGPGQAQFILRNNSKISADEIPAVRRALDEAMKAHGIQPAGAESANTIRITLSENLRERLWVAEIAEGSETRVAMVQVDIPDASTSVIRDQMALRKERLFVSRSDEPILAAIDTSTFIFVLYPDKLIIYAVSPVGIREQDRFTLTHRQSRDPRGFLLSTDHGSSFVASLPGVQCTGAYTTPMDPNAARAEGPFHCQQSDDPWTIPNPDSTIGSTQFKAFYNAARNYFTGVVTPSVGVDLPPFYSAALIPRTDGAALLIDGVDGKVQLVDTGALKPIAGTRDWGSDFAALHSGCGTGTQIVVSGSGEALTDSLRAYEIPAQEAIPASTPLAMEGTVTALWTAPDGKSIFAVVRKPASQGQADTYEVDRVTANCN